MDLPNLLAPVVLPTFAILMLLATALPNEPTALAEADQTSPLPPQPSQLAAEAPGDAAERTQIALQAPATGQRAASARATTRPAPPPRMLGVNLSGAEYGGDKLPGVHARDYIYPSEKELDYFRSRGLLLIRLPFRWERLQPKLNGPLNPQELARLDALIAAIRKRNMRVIPEPHNFGRYLQDRVGSPKVPNTAFADFWRRVASHYASEPAIWAYGLMNEPHDMDGLWPAAAQAAVDAVRSADRTHWILVPGDGWCTITEWEIANKGLEIHDPTGRVMYEGHLYFDADRSGVYKGGGYDGEHAGPNVGPQRMQGYLRWLREHDAIGFVGEFGVPGNDPRWITVLENFLRCLEENSISGTYWAGGPWWGSYPLSIEPADGIDRPQMRPMEQFARRLVTPPTTAAPRP